MLSSVLDISSELINYLVWVGRMLSSGRLPF